MFSLTFFISYKYFKKENDKFFYIIKLLLNIIRYNFMDIHGFSGADF